MTAFGQNVGINDNGSNPDTSAMLDVSSSSKGFLVPRMTLSERESISSPATGLIVYQTDGTSGFYYNYSTPESPSWILIGNAANETQWTTTGSDIYYNIGKVGIGTTSPGHKLSLVGDGGSNTGVLSIDCSNGSESNYVWASSAMAFLNPGGNIIHMIGREESVYNSGYIGFNYQGVGSTSNFLTLGLFNVNNILNITGAGNVGIGTTSPSYNLQVNGSVAGTSAYVNLSDSRLKKDVVAIEDGLDKVMSLRPVSFNWDKSANPKLNLDDRNHLGFLAQEVEQILPQVVSIANDSMQTKAIAYSDVVPVLTAAIQEQQTEIEQLKSEIEELKRMINKLTVVSNNEERTNAN